MRCVRSRPPSWMNDRVEDIVQGALTRIAKKVATGQQDRSYPTSYLMKVANHAVIDEIRKVRRRREVGFEEASGGNELASASRPRGARELAIGAGITECMTQLNEDRRLAVTMYLLGHNVPESAGMLGWTRKRVENLVYRGLAALRACLEHKELAP